MIVLEIASPDGRGIVTMLDDSQALDGALRLIGAVARLRWPPAA
jgi:hypothetical protein